MTLNIREKRCTSVYLGGSGLGVFSMDLILEASKVTRISEYILREL